MSLKGWSRTEKLTLYGLIVATITLIVGTIAAIAALLVVPEFRQVARRMFFEQKTQSENSSPSTTYTPGLPGNNTKVLDPSNSKTATTRVSMNKIGDQETTVNNSTTQKSDKQEEHANPRSSSSKPSVASVIVKVEAVVKGNEWIPFGGYEVELYYKGRWLNATTNENGVARFNSIPCNNQRVALFVSDGRGPKAVGWTRFVDCDESSGNIVNLEPLRGQLAW